MIITQANDDDLSAVLAMRYEASAWLAEIGIDQWRHHWPNKDAMVERVGASIQAGETWMVRDDQDQLAATVALDTYADPQLWTPDEIDEPAMYLHRLIVRRPYAGLGAEILDWASARAAHLDKRWVRIDVWTDNTPLHDYYQRNGFTHVRTLDSDYPSGALFHDQPTPPTGMAAASSRRYEPAPQAAD
jgi:GNAT superfamily N-acetyltransferase